MADLGPPARSTRAIAVALIAAVACVAPGCQSGDPLARKAETVYRDTMQGNPEYRRYALEIAAHTGSPVVRQVLIEAVDDENFQTALVAVKALGDDPPAEAREALRQAFENKRGALKLQAAVALARGGDEAASAFLRQQVEDPAQPLNVSAVLALAQHDGQAVLEPLLRKRMKSDDRQTRDEVYATLGEIRQPWATTLLVEGLGAELGEERKQAIVALGRTGEPKVASEIERFVNTQGLVFATLEALGRLGNPSSVGAVRSMAGNPEGAVRAYAGVALLRLGQTEEALQALEPLLASGDTTVRSVLAEQLAGVDHADARRLLGGLVGDADKAVRIAAVRSLGADPRPEVAPLLLEAAQDGEYEVQTLALNVLARVGGVADLATLGPLVDSDNPYVALSAAQAVLSIQGRSGPA